MNFLFITGLFLYITNYAIGWFLHFRIFSMSKRTHQIFFAGIIINLITILIFVPLSSIHFILCLLSLIMMLILPLGIKGGMYHRIVSTAGLIVYLSLLLLLY